MWTLRQLLLLIIFCGYVPCGNSETTTEDTMAPTNTTVPMATAMTNTTVQATTDSEVENQTVSSTIATIPTTNITMTTTQTTATNATTVSPTTVEITTMETTVTTMMETSTMYVSTTPLPPIVLTNCSSNSNCTFPDSGCNTTAGVCQCNSTFVLINGTSCRSVADFKADINFDNVTETSILISWKLKDYPGVEVYFTITFNGTMVSNISNPHLIDNLTDGEVHSIQITSNVIGRDMRMESVKSDLEFVRTVPKQPTIIINPPYNAPNVTIGWKPTNPNFMVFHINLMGPGISVVVSTNVTNITFVDLKPGTNYVFKIVQETDGPFERNSSDLIKEFRTEPTEPNPPKFVDATAGQRNITINITDTDMPNGKIVNYIFQITYKVYSDEADKHRVTILDKTESGIYILDDQNSHIVPGAEYNISVFTVNDRFNSTNSTSLTGIETLEDVPGRVYPLDNAGYNQTTTSGSIRWGRPLMPNGDMIAYRAVLKEGPNITRCRIYYFCVDICDNMLLGPPNDTCIIQNDTNLEVNQKEMYLNINRLRLGTTYTIHVIGYTTEGPGRDPAEISLKTLSIVPEVVNTESIVVRYQGNTLIVTWNPPPFPGEDLEYKVVLRDAIGGQTLDRQENHKVPYYHPINQVYNYYNYTITITPRTSAGTASSQSQRLFTTPAGGALGKPQNLKIKILRCDSIQIAWQEADVVKRNGPITGYEFENTVGGQKWTYKVDSPNYWSTSNRKYTSTLTVQEKSQYSITIYAVSDISSQRGEEYSSQRFSTEECPADNAALIVLIVLAFLILLGICLVVIIYVYRKKVREIEDVYVHPNRRRSIPVSNDINNILDEDIPLERPFILNDVQKIFEEKSADSNRLFLMEYDDIKKLSQIEGKKRTTNQANLDGNKAKNRYVNILAYDHSRVKLHLIDDDPCSDYINANFIVGYTYEREYIASQGPLPGTVNDFWRMAWEQSATIIVMLTKCKEGNTDKCEHYWPDTSNEPKQYGDIVVNLISVSNMDKFDINIFQVSQGDYTRTIKHFHFLEWPDFSAAVDSTVVIDFIQTVRTHITPEVKGPILIHCSAGVGRTGTYISIDYLLQYVRDHDLSQSVDIFAWVVQMRKNRVSMVQVDKQYIFIHRALVELVERKRNGLLQSNDESVLTNEIVYENTAFQSDDEDEDEEEEDEEEEEPDQFYENAITKISDSDKQQLTEL